MGKSYTTIVDDVETRLQDAGIDPGGVANQVFAAAEIQALIPEALAFVSRYKPWEYKVTKTTSTTSRDLALSTGDKWRLIDVVKAEYEVDQDPREFRNVSRWGDTLTLALDSIPATAADVSLFMRKVHLLQSALGTTDTAGAIDTGAAAGAVSLALKSLGTGTINEMSTLTIAGDSTTYYVISTATIAANAATVSIWPPLAAAVLADAVVTLTVTDSTMDPIVEDHLVRLLAARMAISKATKSYAQVNTAITTLGTAVTAIGAIAAMIAQGITDTGSGRTAAGSATTAIGSGGTEFGLTDAQVDLAVAALVTANTLLNKLNVGGGGQDYHGQAAADVGAAQGFALSGQTFLQQAAADHANAASYYQAAAAEYAAAGRKAEEAIANLRLVATRLQLAQGGDRFLVWGRGELAEIKADLQRLGGYPDSARYARD